jgi:hypothetical protein
MDSGFFSPADRIEGVLRALRQLLSGAVLTPEGLRRAQEGGETESVAARQNP